MFDALCDVTPYEKVTVFVTFTNVVLLLSRFLNLYLNVFYIHGKIILTSFLLTYMRAATVICIQMRFSLQQNRISRTV